MAMERTVNDEDSCAPSRNVTDVEEVNMILRNSHDWNIVRGIRCLFVIQPVQRGTIG